MTAHFLIPDNWVDCLQPETCEENTHLDETADILNSYPTKWVEELIGNCKIHEGMSLTFINSTGQLHKKDGPAVEYAGGRKEWWLNGRLHRENGPANINPEVIEEWWLNGRPHRVDGPAVTYCEGGTEWWLNGQLHREDGPAIQPSDFILNGGHHLMPGPRTQGYDGRQEWWIHGKQIKTPVNEKPSQTDTTLKKNSPASLLEKLRNTLTKLTRTRNL